MIEHTSPHTPEMSGSVSLDEVFAQFEILQRTADVASNKMMKVLEAHPHFLDSLENLDTQTALQATGDFLNQIIAGEELEAMQLQLAELKDATEAMESLEAKHGKRAEAEVARLDHEVLTTTDWHKVAQEITSPNQQRVPYWEVIEGIRNLTVLAPSDNLLEAKRKINAAHQFRDMVSEFGLTLETPLPEQQDGWHTQGNLKQAIDEWNKLSADCITYMSPIKKQWYIDKLPSQELSGLSRVLDHAGLNQNSAPSAIVDAFEYIAATKINEFTAAERDFLKERRQGRSNTLFIANIAEAAQTMRLDPERISGTIHNILERIPPRFTEGLGFITFSTTELNIGDDDFDVGLHDPTNNNIKIELAAFTARVEDYKKLGADEAEAFELAWSFTIGAIVHELGHYAHSNVLTMDELMDWQEALQDEPQAISHYVRTIETIKNDNERNYKLKIEQFSDTWKDFFLHNSALPRKYPRRFAVLNKITGHHAETKAA